MVKNKPNDLHNAAIYKTWQFKIRENAEVEKKRLNIERELRNWQVALEER